MCSCGVGKLKMNEIQVNLPTPRSDRIKQSDSLNFSNAARSVSSSVLALFFFAGLGYLIWLGAAAMEYRWQWYRIEPFFFRSVDNEIIWGPLVKGLIQTLKLAGMAGFFAILIGLFTAFARLSNSISGRVISTFYLESIRNTPLLVQLFLFYFVLAPIFGIDRFWAGILCLAFYEGSFAAEIIRSGILGVDKGQFESADAIGLSVLDKYKDIIIWKLNFVTTSRSYS